MASSNFAQAGLAFGRIRDGELYRMEYKSFDTYCRIKWQYGRDYVDRLIAAAQVFTQLLTICQEFKPEHESQVPLEPDLSSRWNSLGPYDFPVSAPKDMFRFWLSWSPLPRKRPILPISANQWH